MFRTGRLPNWQSSAGIPLALPEYNAVTRASDGADLVTFGKRLAKHTAIMGKTPRPTSCMARIARELQHQR